MLETDGFVVPLSNGFGRDYALGSVQSASLVALADQWDAERLRRIAADLHSQLIRDEVRFTNWYERMMRLSARPGQLGTDGRPSAG